jgi:hypothetical protein
MATYQVLSWHGIPVGVKARDETGQARVNLPERFQVAVDAVATAAGLTDRASYLAGYQWSPAEERPGSAQEVARAVAAETEASFPPERVKALRQELEARLAPGGA